MNQEKQNIEQKIDRYVNGELSAEEIDELWAQIVQKQEHMDYLTTSANLKEVVSDNKPTPIRAMYMYAAAAVIVLLVAVIGTMRFADFNNTPSMVEGISVIELDYYRSIEKSVDEDKQEKIIRKAIELYGEERLDEAVNLLRSEQAKSNDIEWTARLDIMLGTMYYNEDMFEIAADYYSNIVGYKDQVKKLTLEKAYWYLGNSYLQMEMLLKAETTMKKAYALDGAYSRVAKSFLDAIADYKAKTNNTTL
jgi:tetratricopeptide (TPR) repeat protein